MSTFSLRGITWGHERGFDPMVATAKEYMDGHPGVTIEWTQRSLQQFADQPMGELAATYDLIVLDHPHVGEVAASGSLLPLDELVPAERLSHLSDQSVGASHDSYRWQGKQWALAIDAAAQVAAYRPDLIDSVPTRWSEVVELAAGGRVLWPLKPVDSASSFFSLCANRGTPVASSVDVLVREEDAWPVLDAMAAVAAQVPPSCLSMNPIEVLDLMSSSESYAYAPLLYGYTNYSRDGFRDRLVHFTNIPALGEGGPVGSMLGGAGLAISRSCADPDAAAGYALHVADAETQRTTYVEANGQPANAVAWEDDRANELCHGFFTATRETLERSWVRPRHDGYLDVQARVGDLVTGFLSGEVSKADVVAGANEAYRASLSPKPTAR